MKTKALSVAAAASLAMTSFAALSVNAGAENETIYIGSPAAFEKFIRDVNADPDSFEGKTVKLTADIDMSTPYLTDGRNKPAINLFKGTFDGNNHVISNYYFDTGYQYNQNSSTNYGLFSIVMGTIKNLGVSNVGYESDNYESNSNTGSIAGYLDGSMSNCYAYSRQEPFGSSVWHHGTIYGEGNMGGLIGYWSGGGIIEDCWTSERIISYASSGDSVGVGGLIGYCSGGVDIYRCYSTSVIQTPNGFTNVKGLIGKQKYDTRLNDCYYRSEYGRSGGRDYNHTTGLAAEDFSVINKVSGLLLHTDIWYLAEDDPGDVSIYAPTLVSFKGTTTSATASCNLLKDYTGTDDAASLWHVTVDTNSNETISSLGVAVNDKSSTRGTGTPKITGESVSVIFGLVVTAKSDDVNKVTVFVNDAAADTTLVKGEDATGTDE